MKYKNIMRRIPFIRLDMFKLVGSLIFYLLARIGGPKCKQIKQDMQIKTHLQSKY